MTEVKVKVKGSPESITEGIYSMIKSFAEAKILNIESMEALAELTAELANRMKEGEFSGEQEG
jgi:hypothetical protein